MVLVYSRMNCAWLFLFGETPIRMRDAPLFLERREDAVYEANAAGLSVDARGRVTVTAA